MHAYGGDHTQSGVVNMCQRRRHDKKNSQTTIELEYLSFYILFYCYFLFIATIAIFSSLLQCTYLATLNL